jgi:hypothetical protein
MKWWDPISKSLLSDAQNKVHLTGDDPAFASFEVPMMDAVKSAGANKIDIKERPIRMATDKKIIGFRVGPLFCCFVAAESESSFESCLAVVGEVSFRLNMVE